jgi:hypothetical protein
MNARLRAIEAAMPEAPWFERLARTPVDGLLGSLREYYRGFDGVESPFKFERGLDVQRAMDLGLIASLVSDPATLVFLFSGYDFDNAIRMWKAQRLGVTAAYYGCGLVPLDVLENAVAARDRVSLPRYCAALLEMLESGGQSLGLSQAEYLAEAAKWKFLLEQAPCGESRAYTRARIDLANIKTFVRLKRTSVRSASLEMVWLEGGAIERSRYLEFIKGTEEEFYAALRFTDYRDLLGIGLGAEMKLWKIDALIKRRLLGLLGESRYRFFDLSPVLYHLELLDRNYTIVRAIMSGKLNKVPERILLEELEVLTTA